jgi:hypothetical protein
MQCVYAETYITDIALWFMWYVLTFILKCACTFMLLYEIALH